MPAQRCQHNDYASAAHIASVQALLDQGVIPVAHDAKQAREKVAAAAPGEVRLEPTQT